MAATKISVERYENPDIKKCKPTPPLRSNTHPICVDRDNNSMKRQKPKIISGKNNNLKHIMSGLSANPPPFLISSSLPRMRVNCINVIKHECTQRNGVVNAVSSFDGGTTTTSAAVARCWLVEPFGALTISNASA